MKLIELTLTAIGKITAKITLRPSGDHPVIMTNIIQERMERIQNKIQEAIDHIAEAIKPGTPFAEHCDKLNPANSKVTNLHMSVVLPDGLQLGIDLDITTDGFTPKHRDLAELVAEAMDTVLTEIEEMWVEDGANIDEIAVWHTDADHRIAHGFGIPMHGELVGATLGGSGSEGGGIKHGSDAGLDG